MGLTAAVAAWFTHTQRLTLGIQACVCAPHGDRTGSVLGFHQTRTPYRRTLGGSHLRCHLWPGTQQYESGYNVCT